MFDYLRFRAKLFWLTWKQHRISRRYQNDLASAHKRKAKAEEIRNIDDMARLDDQSFDEDVYRLHTRYLFAQAHQLVIPTAKFHKKDMWEEGPLGTRHLSVEALNELRAAIRTERKVNREAALVWVPAITALTGLVGTAIGLVSVFLGGEK